MPDIYSFSVQNDFVLSHFGIHRLELFDQHKRLVTMGIFPISTFHAT